MLTAAPCVTGGCRSPGQAQAGGRVGGNQGLWGRGRAGLSLGKEAPSLQGERCPPAPQGEGPGWQPPPSPGAAGGAGDERELQSRAATADAARAIDCSRSAVWGCGGCGGDPPQPSPCCSPGRTASPGWPGVSEPAEKGHGGAGPRQASSTTALRGAKVTPLHPASAVGIQGRSHSHLVLNIHVSACERLGCSTHTCAREPLGHAPWVSVGVPAPPGPARVCAEPPPSTAAQGCVPCASGGPCPAPRHAGLRLPCTTHVCFSTIRPTIHAWFLL